MRIARLNVWAETYGIPLTTLRLYCLRGTIPANKAGKHWYIAEDAINNFLRGGTPDNKVVPKKSIR